MRSVRRSCSRPSDDKAGPPRARARQGDGQTRVFPEHEVLATLSPWSRPRRGEVDQGRHVVGDSSELDDVRSCRGVMPYFALKARSNPLRSPKPVSNASVEIEWWEKLRVEQA
jgi:hypothetical protein